MIHVRPWQRLTRRLPLMITALLAAVVAGVSWAAYVQIRRATIDAGEAHLESAVRQIGSMLDASLRRARQALAAYADTAAAPSQSQLDRLCRNTPSCVAAGVWDEHGRRVMSSGSSALAEASGTALLVSFQRTGELAGPFTLHKDTVVYAVGAPLRTGRGAGGLVIFTFGLGNGTNADAVARLLGRGARLFVGNADGDLWTDLIGRAAPPPRAARLGTRSNYTASDGRNYTGVSTSLAVAPWMVVADAPVDVPLATAREFLAEIVGFGLLFALAGGAGVWLIVRRVVGPLDSLRRAADLISVGGFPDHLDDRRRDEIGGLARTFNAMAMRIRSAGQALTDRAEALERRNEALDESERRYRQLVDQLPDAVVVHREHTILFANPAAATMFGAAGSSDLVGRSLLDLVQPQDRELVREQIEAAYRNSVSSPAVELHLQRLDGGTLVGESYRTSVVFDGAPAVQSLVRDITERRLLEEQYRQSQKMEAIGRLAGGIAHDFNNLLTVINTYAEFTIAATSPDDARRTDVEEIRRAAMSAASLTRQMLAFSRKQVLAPRVLNVNDVVTGLTAMVARALPDDIEVVTHLHDDLWSMQADVGQLEQVLMNLVVNARDAMPDGGRLVIETANVDLDDTTEAHRRLIPPGEYVTLSVTDTGTGMSDEVKAHIFEPFYTTKRAGEGTGLGLATAYGIVKQSGGYIWVYTEPGRGTSFKLYFPRHADSEPLVPAASGEFPVSHRATARILLVEDDANVRTAICRILERSPHEVHAAASATEAIRMFEADPGGFDLVVTDMIMPGMSGGELIHRLRALAPDLCVIIMSGYSEEMTSREWRLPANALFLEKPVAPRGLLRAIDDVLAGDAD